MLVVSVVVVFHFDSGLAPINQDASSTIYYMINQNLVFLFF